MCLPLSHKLNSLLDQFGPVDNVKNTSSMIKDKDQF